MSFPLTKVSHRDLDLFLPILLKFNGLWSKIIQTGINVYPDDTINYKESPDVSFSSSRKIFIYFIYSLQLSL